MTIKLTGSFNVVYNEFYLIVSEITTTYTQTTNLITQTYYHSLLIDATSNVELFSVTKSTVEECLIEVNKYINGNNIKFRAYIPDTNNPIQHIVDEFNTYVHHLLT